MTEVKTKKNNDSVEDFLNSVENETRRKDSFIILEMMKKISGDKPKMWGSSIIGFSDVEYKYDSGRTGTWFKIGFSPRKQSITIYIMPGFEKFDELMAQLGKHKTGKSCLYINKLADVDIKVLEEIATKSYRFMSKAGTLGNDSFA